MNKFAPLTEAEIAAAIAAVPEEDCPTEGASQAVLPVPADAPSPPTSHPKLGKPAASWEYKDAEGNLLFVVNRFNLRDGRKIILPLSVWRDKDGALNWLWKGVPAPRPLFNLDKLAFDQSKPVVIAEGEKSAVAAQAVFHDHIVTTSPNGSSAADKADWSPLAGRKVIVWPDGDEAGQKYAADVGAILFDLGAEIRVIDARALALKAPDGGERESFKPGWDAADAIEEWAADLPKLKQVAASLAKPYVEAGARYVSYEPYEMRADGLWIEIEKGKGESATVIDVKVCQAFEIVGITRDTNGAEWGKLIRWRDKDRKIKTMIVTDAETHGDPGTLCQKLRNVGLYIKRNCQRYLAIYLSDVLTNNRVRLVERTGWHHIGGRDVFVLPEQSIGPDGGETVVFNSNSGAGYEAKGTLDGWKNGVGHLSAGQRMVVLAISAALAGPILYLAGQAGGGIHFVGPSSKGKSTLQRAAASVWGGGFENGFIKQWRATANGLEGAAANTSDTALVLDELGQIDAREFAPAVYAIANGSGKQRAGRDGHAREVRTWRVMVISSGELTVAAKIGEDRFRRAMAGQEVRLLDIHAVKDDALGVFDSTGGFCSAADLARAFSVETRANYGVAGPEFVRRLIAANMTRDDVNTFIREFVSANALDGVDGQIDRALQRFALIATAGELAISLGIVPWAKGAASDAAATAFNDWIEMRGGVVPAEDREAISRVRLFIEKHGNSRFEDIVGDDDAPLIRDRLGWRREHEDGREWWVLPEVWKSEICAGMDPTRVARTLAVAGLLRVPNGRGFQCLVSVNGQKLRAYVLTAGILCDDALCDDAGSGYEVARNAA
ncbi:DUF927 domain-containing protein [Methylocystis parvus]|uniref:DUF927 domain-containing protein n=1 Tax=Methylocystis parvus TaxID=134 RepID=A0A6B8M9D6_9HYPH|nr:DUF927 domain-containing protein [Methylocystis parvus]QGM98432.1 DUF927 domain-containing protein [Methylocystis parvus]WBK01233.1 DUF927 domain-containing protein [Methylocystis parvus OBBP]